MLKTAFCGWLPRGSNRHLTKIMVVMRLTTILLTIALLQVSAHGLSQNVRFSGTNVPLSTVLTSVKEQTGVVFIYEMDLLKHARPVTLDIKDMPLKDFLTISLKDQPFHFSIKNQTVVISRKYPPHEMPSTRPFLPIKGRITDMAGSPLANASIINQRSQQKATSDALGNFTVEAGEGDVLLISYLGYQPRSLAITAAQLSDTATLIVALKPGVIDLDNVEVTVNTGYQQVARERATGSFTYINNATLSRGVGSNILDRLEAVTPGLDFIRKDLQKEIPGKPVLRIRGMSTILADPSPLIVLDNFPYDGDLDAINPNDIESITLLKDAAAASIWGARAGNGVIVITSKAGKTGSAPRLSFSSSLRSGRKPDLFYNRQIPDARSYIDIERELFARQYYQENDWTLLSPAVEAMIRDRDGLLKPGETLDGTLNELAGHDIRVDAGKYLYTTAWLQQYALNVSGGGDRHSYFVSAGFDDNIENIKGNTSQRYTITGNFSFQPLKGLELDAGINWTLSRQKTNGIGITNLRNAKPYIQLADSYGNPLAIPYQYRTTYLDKALEEGLLDWHYRPLDEVAMGNSGNEDQQVRLRAGARYQLMPGLSAELKFQHQRGAGENYSRYHKESYYARDLVNRFTQPDGSLIIQEGAIWAGSNSRRTENTLRTQLSYVKDMASGGALNVIAGYERRSVVSQAGPGYYLFSVDEGIGVGTTRVDYNTQFITRPQQVWSRISNGPDAQQRQLTDNFISYFSNAAYTVLGKYTLSASARFDQSNLFGVKANQKGVPLWSAGALWAISRESFYRMPMLPDLKLRVTYGESGNVDKSLTAYPIASFGTNSANNFIRADLRNTGNPSLKWERVQTLNFGVDFSTAGRRVSGSIEYYRKRGLDILGDDVIDPTTGLDGAVLQNRINYASTSTRGWDLLLNSRNIEGAHFSWQTQTLLSIAKNKVTDYYNKNTGSIIPYLSAIGTTPPVVGHPQQYLYSFPWHGLDAQGNPVVYWEGVTGNEYTKYINNAKIEEQVYHGPAVPVLFGSLRNTVEWKRCFLSANLSFKGGYYFRKNMLLYESLYANAIGDREYADRWQQPGDELHTYVPGKPADPRSIGMRDVYYQYAAVHVAKGDHIRLRDVQLGYRTGQLRPGSIIRSMEATLMAENLGLLWSANRFGIDPDYPNATYPPAPAFSLSIKMNL